MNKHLSEKERHDYIEQALDPNKVALICGRHNYAAGDLSQWPTEGCPNCMMVWFVHHFAKIPAHLREQKLDEMERAIRDACALESHGKFDFQAFTHPDIKIEHE